MSETFGEDSDFTSGQKYEDNFRLEYTYNDEEHCIYVDQDNSIVFYQYMFDYSDSELYSRIPETRFIIDNSIDLTQYKTKATELMSK